MKLASWNVNSIRARQDSILSWLKKHQPDVLCLQETKCRDEHIPFLELSALGYETVHFGLNHWNGVAILSKHKLRSPKNGFEGSPKPPFNEARLISAAINEMRVISVYVPNGRDLENQHYIYKLKWLARLKDYLTSQKLQEKNTIIMGDFNIAPADIDVYDPKRWEGRTHTSPKERAVLAEILKLGFIDAARHLKPEKPQYSWWNYRANCFEKDFGLRIDLALVSPRLEKRLIKCWVDKPVRAQKRPSDHAPVVIELS